MDRLALNIVKALMVNWHFPLREIGLVERHLSLQNIWN